MKTSFFYSPFNSPQIIWKNIIYYLNEQLLCNCYAIVMQLLCNWFYGDITSPAAC